MKTIAFICLGILYANIADICRSEDIGGGQVHIPLSQYTQLIDAAKNPPKAPRPAPAHYALGEARVNVSVTENEGRASAQVALTMGIRVFENDWTLIPVLPAGVPVTNAAVGGNPIELIPSPHGLAWSVKESGSYVMSLGYSVDASKFEKGFSLALPVPTAASLALAAVIPGANLDVAVIPSSGAQVRSTGESTTVQAAIPAAGGVQISWRTAAKQGHYLSRAQYAGKLSGKAVAWSGDFQVEMLGEEAAIIKLLPQRVTLNDIKIDGKSSPILVEGDFFATLLKGKGTHKITADFQSPLAFEAGPPKVTLTVPQIPVSRFDLTLPGKKEVAVVPAAEVAHQINANDTVATVFVPMSESVTLSWSEALPEEIKTELRANVGIYHTIHAEEGILSVKATARYEMTRGETNVLELETPKSIEITRISSPGGEVADWRIVRGDGQKPDLVNVFLDRQVKSSLQLDILYDRSLAGLTTAEKIPVPLLRARSVHRQTGMIALLASRESTLKPVEEKDVTRVGENQLPPFVRDNIKMTVAHTFKYAETVPFLAVQIAAPERKEGKFDAVVNTLVSLTDVSMKGSASVEINVKSGTIDALKLELPREVNVLSLTAPSLRTYKVENAERSQVIDVQFTQDMEGQFRVEVGYESIMSEAQKETRVPTLSVAGAEVEQGRIAVEALSAVEVQPASIQSLSSVDPAELPQQLVLKTTNPILLSYKYVRVDPPYELTLKMTRHKEIEVQSATIDRAAYRTLFTRDGLAVTTAEFLVKNTREQFLKIRLPAGSKVWSVFVNGKAEKPALAQGADADRAPNVLIKIVNSAQGFPVNLIYQTPVSKIKTLGVIRGSLPSPDMLVTMTHWDIYLPEGISYGKPDGNMELIGESKSVSSEVIKADMERMASNVGRPVIAPLHFTVPAAGTHFAFQKLYANQADEDAGFSLPYASGVGRGLNHLLAAIGAALFWLGLGAAFKLVPGCALRGGALLVAVGVLCLTSGVRYLGASWIPAAVVTSLAGLLGAAKYLKRRRGNLQSE